MLKSIRRHLGWKIFLSYMAVIFVGVTVLATATEFVAPAAFNRHVADMETVMRQVANGQASTIDLNESLFASFHAAITESIAFSVLAASVAAIIAGYLVTRQLVAPIRGIMEASQRIADGHYDERVHVPGNPATGEMDELAQLAVSFNRMASALERNEEIRRRLIGDVSHELRTPLATIRGYLEGLIDGVLPANAETFQKIHREASRLQRLVDDLQELSKVEGGGYVLRRRRASIKALVDATVGLLAPQFAEKGVRLEEDVPVGLPDVVVDEDRMRQVLLNLVGNALQYTPAGGTVRITARRAEDEIQVSISDTGIGIPPEHLHHIFERFYRVDKSRSRAGGGSGIGLTIA
ncbi:MAG: HAMP domain-containing protein, partial [Anaerolineae bacterium]|nr:HAMP domain-containing protein [Anaerolineae bacterium]